MQQHRSPRDRVQRYGPREQFTFAWGAGYILIGLAYSLGEIPESTRLGLSSLIGDIGVRAMAGGWLLAGAIAIYGGARRHMQAAFLALAVMPPLWALGFAISALLLIYPRGMVSALLFFLLSFANLKMAQTLNPDLPDVGAPGSDLDVPVAIGTEDAASAGEAGGDADAAGGGDGGGE